MGITAGNEKSKKKNKLWLAAALLLFAAACILTGLCLSEWLGRKRAEERLAELAVEAEKKETAAGGTASGEAGEETSLEEKKRLLREAYGIEVPEKNPDFAGLRENSNPDIYAWIYLPGTAIDYPVLQHPSEASYYMNHNLDGSGGRPACIYSQYYNAKDFTDRMTVLYGHNMRDGSMFADLHNYEDAEFFNENPYIYIYTEDNVFVYKIFAAHTFSDAHLLLSFDWSVDEIFLNYLKSVTETKDLASNVDYGAEFTAESRILTLLTCVDGAADRRYLVQGVLLDAEPDMDGDTEENDG